METVLLFVLGVVIFVVGLGVSIALHEAGHLTTAKLFGVKVTQYMIGFGKTLFSVRRGETEYGVKAIPLGGYIAMIGMFPPKHPGDALRASSTGFYNQMIDDARLASSETIGPGEENRAFYRLAPWKRIIVMFAGPFMNLVIAFVLFGIILVGIGVQTPANVVGSVVPCVGTSSSCPAGSPASPAKQAGFQAGDTILSVDGTATPTWADVSAVLERSAGHALPVVVERDGSRHALTVTPQQVTRQQVDAAGKPVVKDGKAVMQTVGVIGIEQGYVYQRQPITAVVPVFGNAIGQTANIVINLPQRMVEVWNAAFGTQARQANGPVGIIGVGRLAGDVVSDSHVAVIDRVQVVLSILASLNIALFVFNMIPLLPLDGGHIAGACWEWIKRAFARVFRRKQPHPVDMAKLMPLTYAVVIVLGAMTVVLAYADIVKPVTLGG